MLGASSHVGVRAARRADAEALVSVFAASWRHAYTGIIPHLHLDLLIRRRTPKWWSRVISAGESVTVLEVDGKIVGYATFGPARNRGKYQGEIYELYIAPTHQCLGFGELLFESCRYQLDQRSYNGLILWALSDNTSAIDFYWRRGGRPIATTIDRIGRARLEKVALTWN
ncbi:MAG: GNAT family N-acetyltransferase [Hyphomicrobiaceae bacterium]